jgi:hypothetical protein
MKPRILILLASLVFVPSVFAHHGTSGQFDLSKEFYVGGVITDVAFVNPHAYVYFDVTDANGQVTNWHCEMRGATVLMRSGWTQGMFETGRRIDLLAKPSHQEPTGCYIETVSFNGGPAIQRYQQLEKNKPNMDTARPLRTKWGTPNFAGDWAAVQHLPDPGNIVPNFSGSRLPKINLTAAGEAAVEAAQLAEGDNITGRLDCTPRDVMNDWIYNQNPNRIIQTEDKITFLQGFMDVVKEIHMNMVEHPDSIEPSWNGHSIGKWEDDVLVVDTIGYTLAQATPSLSRGPVHSEQLHTVERYTLDAENLAIHRSYIAEDPLFWEDKMKREDIVHLSDIPYAPYNCDDRAVE